MAGNQFTASAENIATGTSGNWESKLRVKAGANVGIRPIKFGLYFKGTNAAGAKVQVRVVTGVGDDGTAATVVPVKRDASIADSVQATAKAAYSAAASGTPAVIEEYSVSPIGFVEISGLPRIPGGGSYTLQTKNTGSDVNFTAQFIGEE